MTNRNVSHADEVVRELRKRVGDARRQARADQEGVVHRLGADVVTRLALAPVWTPAVLAASELAAPETLAELARVGVATSDTDRFVIARDTAEQLVAQLSRRDGRAVTTQLRVVLEGLLRAGTSLELPPTLRRFAELVAPLRDQAIDDRRAAQAIEERLLALVRGAPDQADAVNWIDAAARLELGFERPVVNARLKAGRLLEMLERDAARSAFLSGYFARPRLESRLRAHCAHHAGAEQEPWAVHLRGEGGIGKTMLVRWLETRFPSDGSQGSVVRVDFDHLHPTYPSTEPGLLITVMAAALQPFAPGEGATAAFAHLDALVADWHQRMLEAERTAAVSSAGVREGRRGVVEDAFADALRTLPPPVVLVLDTTEELDKVGPADQNAAAALAMLERLCAAVPAVRVVLSGRRPLPARRGVEEVPMVGFDEEEARSFVLWVGVDGDATDGGPGPRGAAVLERVVADQDGHRRPFDLAFWARWARDDPALSPEAILAIPDERYVELRILGRLGDPTVRRAIPAVVALGRFDATSLGGTTGTQGAELDHLLSAVTRQEWVTHEGGGTYGIDPSLRPRLEAYLETKHREEFADARSRAAEYLRRLCVSAEAGTVTVEHVAAAIRLSRGRSTDLVRWWDEVEDGARRSGAFGWLHNVTSRLLGEAETSTLDELHGPVLVSFAAATARTAPTLPAALAEVWRAAHRRAAPGSRAAARAAAHLPHAFDDELEAWAGCIDDALAASFLGGLEVLLDEHPTGDGSWTPVDSARRLAAILHDRSSRPELVAASELLVGRAEVASLSPAGGRPLADADQAVTRARHHLAEAVLGVTRSPYAGMRDDREWMDWPVDDLAARVRVSAAAAWYPTLGGPDEAGALLDLADGRSDVDSDREASLALTLGLAAGTAVRSVARSSIRAAASTSSSRVAAHRRIPPLAVTRALADASCGLIQEALDDLAEYRTEFPAGENYLAAERARMDIVRLFRLRDVGEGQTTGLVDSSDPDDLALLADLDAFDGDKAADQPWNRPGVGGRRERQSRAGRPAGAGEAHRWWRTVRGADMAALEAATSWAIATAEGVDRSPDELHHVLDRAELAVMRRRSSRTWVPEAWAWVQAHRHAAEAAFRVAVRTAALAGERKSVLDQLARRLGAGRAGRVAMDEGDSLALRLPVPAARVLRWSAEWHAAAGDPVSEVRARTAMGLAQLLAGTAPPTDDRMFLWRAHSRMARRLDLPPLDRLLDNPRSALREAPRCWRPWLCRLAFVVSAQDPAGRRAVGDAVVDLLGASGTAGGILLPADLAPHREALLPRRRRRRRPSSTARKDVRSTMGRGRRPPQTPPAVLEIDGGGLAHATHVWRGGPVRFVRPDTGHVAETTMGHPVLAARLAGSDAVLEVADLMHDVAPGTGVELRHTPDVGAAGWEAMLATSLGPTPGAALERPTWRRVRGARRRSGGGWSLDPILVVAADQRAFRNVWLAGTTLSDDRLGPSALASTLHIVGWATEGRSGVGIGLWPPSGTRPSRVMTADEVLEAYPQANLVVLQGVPDDAIGPAPHTLEQAGYLRQLGTDLVLRGVPAVVVVPGLPTATCENAIAALATPIVAAGVLAFEPLVKATVDARAYIGGPGVEVGSRAYEDALGVSLIVSDAIHPQEADT